MNRNPLTYGSNNPNNDIRKKIEDYSYGLNQKIGKGFSSVVFRGLNEKTKEQVAIKVIDIKTINKDKLSKEMFEGEIEALRKFNHANLIKCNDIYSTINNCYIITEFCNEGDLDNLLRKRIKLSEEQCIPIFRDVYLGFKYIAEEGFVHRDLKPANIMMKDQVAKIGDFGFTKRIPAKSTQFKESFNVGSPLYMSPQALKRNIYSIKSDIWSLGILLYQMLHGRTPWQSTTQKQLAQKMTSVSISLIRNLSDNIKDFIRQCLMVEQDKRIDLAGMARHPFIRRIMGGDMPNLLRKATSIENNKKDRVSGNENRDQMQRDKPSSNHLIHPIDDIRTSSGRAQKHIQVQINWMRFLSRLAQMFPSVSQTAPGTMGLRFIILKQIFSQLNALKEALDLKENVFNIQSWPQFVKEADRLKKYQVFIPDYSKKYQKYSICYNEWIKIVNLDSKLSKIANKNFQRSEELSVLGIAYSLDEIKTLWGQVKRDSGKLTTEDLPEDMLKTVHRLDFLITYYLLNCLLVDNFHNPDYFYRLSKIQHSLDYKPAVLAKTHLKDIENKLNALQIYAK